MNTCSSCGVRVSKRGRGCRSCKQTQRRRNEKQLRRCRNVAMEQPSIVRSLSYVEAAWVGALLEGEGSIGLIAERTRSKRRLVGITRHARIFCGSTSIETIATLLRLIGEGNIYLRPPVGTHKPIWVYVLTKRQSLRALLPQVKPYLTDKQENATRVLAFLGEGS